MMSAVALRADFQEAKREVQGITAAWERRTLAAFCARMPGWVSSDHLTALGVVGTVGAGAAYALAARNAAWLHVVNLCLVVNWFGDSLDGTLARYRHQERPRYGFYIDHILDAIGALFVLGGLAVSGLMSPAIAALFLIVYYLAAIHVYLTTYTVGTFKISYGPIGGTELRVLLALANVAALAWPSVALAGFDVRLFDIAGVAATLGLAVVLAMWIPSVTRQLLAVDAAARDRTREQRHEA